MPSLAPSSKTTRRSDAWRIRMKYPIYDFAFHDNLGPDLLQNFDSLFRRPDILAKRLAGCVKDDFFETRLGRCLSLLQEVSMVGVQV